MPEVQPDNQAAIDFLKRWAPGGPWVLTAIQTDRKAISTQTFGPGTEAALIAFLSDYNGKRNLYFHVNPPMKALSKKAEREDIKSMDWLHVDIDPRAGEDLEQERARCLALFTTNLPKGIPAPTVIIFSGGGYQGFWRLEHPIAINGDVQAAEKAKLFNLQLEHVFGGDHCHNIDRIMRLPGTVNIPDAKKIKKGRQPTLAALVEFRDAAYSISEFTPAPELQLPNEPAFGSGSFGKTTVVAPGNIERLGDISELDQWSVPDRVKVIIVQGRHPDEPKPEGKNSRSEWLFDAVCQMVRHAVPDDVIYSVITDPQFAISESILEKGGGAEKYALKQLRSAKEEAVDPWLRKLNAEFAVVRNLGGKCRVIEEVLDRALKRTRLSAQTMEDFSNGWRHIQVQVGTNATGIPLFKPLGKWWLDNPQRRGYNFIEFAPNEADVEGTYNLWKGFAVVAKPGDCSLLLAHIRDNVCVGNPVYYDYFMGWLATMVQHPGRPGEVAVVLRGGKGVGKSFVAKAIGSLFGRHFVHISNPSHLVGNFNAHLRDALFLFADEAFYANDKKHASILKALVTEETVQIERKGVDVETAPNFIHLMMASNDWHVVPASGDERRYFVLDVGKGRQQDATYFAAIAKQLDEGGREALLHELLTYDLKDFRVHAVPQTEALRDQKAFSLSVEEDWWYHKLQEGVLFDGDKDWPKLVRKAALVDDYIEHTRRWAGNGLRSKGSETALGMYLKRIVPNLDTIQAKARWTEMMNDGFSKVIEKRANHWRIAPLEECRKKWETEHGLVHWQQALSDGTGPLADEPDKAPF